MKRIKRDRHLTPDEQAKYNAIRDEIEYVKSAGLAKRGGCHLFRHTTATLMHEAGADIRHIQALLGHARLDTTQIYTRVSIKKLREVHEKTHPARMKRNKKDVDPDSLGDGDQQ